MPRQSVVVQESNSALAGVVTAQTAIHFEAHWEVAQLHQGCAQLLDGKDFSAWPGLFTKDCLYQIQLRENFDAGLPLCIPSFESQDMLRDREHGAQQTIFHDLYHQRHILSAPNTSAVSDNWMEAETSYLVARTQ
jgi:salicylate 5-hydroxylase small subunit